MAETAAVQLGKIVHGFIRIFGIDSPTHRFRASISLTGWQKVNVDPK